MPDVCLCGPATRFVPEVIDALNGDAPAPGAITIGDLRIYLNRTDFQSESTRRHERMHTTQCARMAPWWARWLPFKVRAWLGTPKFLREYKRLHDTYGYKNNPLEMEARDAERD